MAEEAVYRVSPREARRIMIEIFQARLVPYLQSSPGIGKSSITHSIANEFKAWLIDHRLSTSDPTDMTGMPNRDEHGNAYFAPFTEVFPVEDTVLPKGFEGWMLFLDEFSSAPRSVQAAAYKLILDRKVGQRKLHERVLVAAAGNLATDRAIVNPIGTAMQSRLVHLELEVNFDEWLEDVAFKHNYDPRIIAFLGQFPSKLMDFRPDHHDKTFCCPRTWEFANKLIKGKDMNDERAKMLAGTVTSGVAMEFYQFSKIWKDLVSIQDILKDPKGCRIPEDLSIKWATISHMLEKIEDTNFTDLATYVNRFDMSFRVLFYRSITVRQSHLRTHKAFINGMAELNRYLNG